MLGALDTPEVILALAPAVFGLLGTLLGAGLTYRAKVDERHAAEDDKARLQLVNVSAAVHRASWFSKFGASQPDDVNPGPGGLGDELRKTVKEARAALLSAGVPFRVASAALEPTERLALRLGNRSMLAEDPDDAQALVAFLFELLDRRRAYRHGDQAWTKLNEMEELERGRRPLPGFDESQAPFTSG
jgi:hypothetical protein